MNSTSLTNFKNDLLILLNNISLRKFGQSLFDYLKVLNFMLKKPGNLVLELLNEDRKNDKEKVTITLFKNSLITRTKCWN